MKFTETPNLKGARLSLRLAKKKDVPGIIEFYRSNKDHFEKHASPRPMEIYTREYWHKQVLLDRGNFENDRLYSFWGFLNSQQSKPIAHIKFFTIVRGTWHACTLGYLLDESEQGKGLMTEGLNLATRFVFDEMHIHRIMANHGPDNIRSSNTLKRVGFVKEGYAKDYLLVNGEWQDHVLTSLTNENWTAPTD